MDKNEKGKKVFEYTLTLNGAVKFDKPVSVGRISELNGILANQKIDVGDEVNIKIVRAF